MKKIATIFCILIYSLGATEAYQLLKLPILIQHFVQHKKSNTTLNIIDFLKEHYPEKIVIDDDFAQDMQLPFKTQQLNTLIIEVVTTCTQEITVPTIYLFNNNLQVGVYKNPCHVHVLEKGIFQPPKKGTLI